MPKPLQIFVETPKHPSFQLKKRVGGGGGGVLISKLSQQTRNKVIKKLNSKKPTDLDKNALKILSNSENSINSYLRNIINYNLLKYPFSKDAKTASVRSIIKKGQKILKMVDLLAY